MTNHLYTLLIVCFAGVSTVGYSQDANSGHDKRVILGVAPFTSATENQKKYCAVVAVKTLDIIKKTNRFRIVDLDGKARKIAKDKAKENYKAENWNDAGSGADLHAKYTLTGFIQALKFIRLNSGSGYKATISFTIKVMETSTGSVIHNGTQTFTSSGSEIKLTPENALQSALNSLDDQIYNYFVTNFPLELEIAKIKTHKGDQAQELLLYGGSSFGVKKGQTYVVYTIDRSLGSPLPTEIGKIKISEVVNATYAEAKVTKKGAEIYKAITDKKEIICKLVD